MSDAELAERLDRTISGVELRRTRRKIPKFNRIRVLWTAKANRLLGKVSDKEIAQMLNCTVKAVSLHRFRLGIPARKDSASSGQFTISVKRREWR
jgi:hypothetical protein